MQEIENPSLEQMRAFLETSQEVQFHAEGRVRHLRLGGSDGRSKGAVHAFCRPVNYKRRFLARKVQWPAPSARTHTCPTTICCVFLAGTDRRVRGVCHLTNVSGLTKRRTARGSCTRHRVAA